jgi:hypothetical protein
MWRQPALDNGISNLLPAVSRVIMCSMTAEGTVYLLHFDRPYKGQMRHYNSRGMTWNNVWRATVRAALPRLRNWRSIKESDLQLLVLGPVRRN